VNPKTLARLLHITELSPVKSRTTARTTPPILRLDEDSLNKILEKYIEIVDKPDITAQKEKLQELDKRVGKLYSQVRKRLELLNEINEDGLTKLSRDLREDLTSRVNEVKRLLQTVYNFILKIQAEQRKAINILKKGDKQEIIEKEKEIETAIIYYLSGIEMEFKKVNTKISRIKAFIKDENDFSNPKTSQNTRNHPPCVVS
jgi:hypothetical protein